MATKLLTWRCLHTLLCILWPLCKRLLIWHSSPPSTSPARPSGPCPYCSSPPPSPPRSSSPSRWTRGETRVRRAFSRSPPSAPPSRAPSRTPGNIAAATSDQMSVFYFEHICATTTRLIKYKKYFILSTDLGLIVGYRHFQTRELFIGGGTFLCDGPARRDDDYDQGAHVYLSIIKYFIIILIVINFIRFAGKELMTGGMQSKLLYYKPSQHNDKYPLTLYCHHLWRVISIWQSNVK